VNDFQIYYVLIAIIYLLMALHFSSALKNGAYDAICSTLPVEAPRLRSLRGPGESFSDAILRLVGMEGGCAP
jgi:hypothetical protein